MKQLEKENQIREYFDFYQKEVLPLVEKLGFQQEEGYHGLYTHTKAVVFRAIDYHAVVGDCAGFHPGILNGRDQIQLAFRILQFSPRDRTGAVQQTVIRMQMKMHKISRHRSFLSLTEFSRFSLYIR